jgi:hypothetical protein
MPGSGDGGDDGEVEAAAMPPERVEEEAARPGLGGVTMAMTAAEEGKMEVAAGTVGRWSSTATAVELRRDPTTPRKGGGQRAAAAHQEEEESSVLGPQNTQVWYGQTLKYTPQYLIVFLFTSKHACALRREKKLTCS